MEHCAVSQQADKVAWNPRKMSLLEILFYLTIAQADGKPHMRTTPKRKLWVTPQRLPAYWCFPGLSVGGSLFNAFINELDMGLMLSQPVCRSHQVGWEC